MDVILVHKNMVENGFSFLGKWTHLNECIHQHLKIIICLINNNIGTIKNYGELI